jgi:hypothetical protein
MAPPIAKAYGRNFLAVYLGVQAELLTSWGRRLLGFADAAHSRRWTSEVRSNEIVGPCGVLPLWWLGAGAAFGPVPQFIASRSLQSARALRPDRAGARRPG